MVLFKILHNIGHFGKFSNRINFKKRKRKNKNREKRNDNDIYSLINKI